MTKKYSIIILLHLFFIAVILVNHDLIIKDIVELYFLVYLPSLVLTSIIYLFNKKGSYFHSIKKELTKTSLVQIGVFIMIIFSTQTRYISKNNAIADLDSLKEKLEDIHPDIYYSIPVDSFALILNKSKNTLPGKVSELEFYKECSMLTSLFKDGHTRTMPDLLNNRMQLAVRAIFPYNIKIINEKIFVIDNLTLFGRVPIGSEILGINGKTAIQFINEMSQIVSYENTGWRNKLISDPFTIGIWNNYKSYKIIYKKPGSDKVSRVSYSGGFFSKMYIFYLAKIKRPGEFVFRVLPGNIGYIGFYGCNDLKHYCSFYEHTFRKIKEKNIIDLIIDIRNNGGGYSQIGAELMQYLFHKPFRETDSIAFRISRELSETGKMDHFLNPEERVFGKMFSKVTSDPYIPRDNPLRFPGKCFLLIDNGTFSAGTMFASSFKCFADGTLIGEETGGVSVGFGNVHFFNLPNSKMKIMVSWNKFYNVCGINDRHGVMPDYFVSNTIEDYMFNKDKALEFAIDMIKKQ